MDDDLVESSEGVVLLWGESGVMRADDVGGVSLFADSADALTGDQEGVSLSGDAFAVL